MRFKVGLNCVGSLKIKFTCIKKHLKITGELKIVIRFTFLRNNPCICVTYAITNFYQNFQNQIPSEPGEKFYIMKFRIFNFHLVSEKSAPRKSAYLFQNTFSALFHPLPSLISFFFESFIEFIPNNQISLSKIENICPLDQRL